METMGTGNKNHCVTEVTHVFQRKLNRKDKCDLELFWNRLVHRFYHLKALITFEKVNTSVVGKKKRRRILISKTSMVRQSKLSLYANDLVMSMQFIFGDN